jgi:uncharacterized phage-associated protein
VNFPFDIEKSAQCAHFFAEREGGEIEILKLVKLIYLADRRSLETRKIPISGGHYYSLKHGPVTSEVLDLINEGTPEGNSPWERLISDRANHKVAAVGSPGSYSALAPSEIEILNEVWDRFGTMSKWAVVEWTHRHCEEWADPDGGRLEIKARKLAEAFAWTDDEVENFLEELNSTNRLHALLA